VLPCGVFGVKNSKHKGFINNGDEMKTEYQLHIFIAIFVVVSLSSSLDEHSKGNGQ